MKLIAQMTATIIVSYAIVWIVSCQRDRPIGTQPHVGRVEILLFAAGYCGPCKEEMPMVRDWYNELPLSKKQHVAVVVYLIGGNTSGEAPTQAYADKFKAQYLLPFDVRPDRYGRVYRNYFASGFDVPSTVFADEAGTAFQAIQGRKIHEEELSSHVNTWTIN